MTDAETQKEIIKLSATYLNGIAVLMTGAGLVALPIALLSQPTNAWVFNFMGPGLVIGGVLMHFLARSFMSGINRKQPSDPAATE